MLGKEPYTQHDQDDRPEAMQAEVKDSVDKKQRAQADEDGGCGWNLGGLKLFSRAEGLRQPEWIRSRFARLNRLGSTNRVQNLVHPEEPEEDSQNHVSLPREVGR